MPFNAINPLAVGAATVAGFLLGCVWFPVFFRKPYLRGLGKTAEELAKGPSAVPSLLLQALGSLAMAWVLAWLVSRTGTSTALGGVRLGFIAWLGFIAAVLGPYYAFRAYPLSFFAINAGYPLASLVLMGAILGAWKA